jgi:hypothetical protein
MHASERRRAAQRIVALAQSQGLVLAEDNQTIDRLSIY